jgi:hypothetical protein
VSAVPVTTTLTERLIDDTDSPRLPLEPVTTSIAPRIRPKAVLSPPTAARIEHTTLTPNVPALELGFTDLEDTLVVARSSYSNHQLNAYVEPTVPKTSSVGGEFQRTGSHRRNFSDTTVIR